MTSSDRFLGVAMVGVGLSLFSACAARPGALPASSVRAPAEGPEPTTVEEAQADIDRSRQVLGGGQAPVATQSAQPGAERRETTSETSTSGASGGPTSPCVTPCRAIASMRRSVAALCRLSGEEDLRCVDARKTLTESEQRVVPCGC